MPDEEGGRRELGQDAEDRALRELEDRQVEDPRADEMDRPPDPGGASSSDPAGSAEARSSRGPDLQPRVRRTWAGIGVGATEAPDWSTFGIGRTVRALKVCTPAQARLNLRKLHLRRWHAQVATMDRILKRAGVPKQVCDLIPEIVHTCTSCRAWRRPPPASVASVELADAFNQQVECDLLFVFTYIIIHLIDRCARLHAACLIPSTEDHVLIDALNTIWVGVHGPMGELIMDGESGMARAELDKQ